MGKPQSGPNWLSARAQNPFQNCRSCGVPPPGIIFFFLPHNDTRLSANHSHFGPRRGIGVFCTSTGDDSFLVIAFAFAFLNLFRCDSRLLPRTFAHTSTCLLLLALVCLCLVSFPYSPSPSLRRAQSSSFFSPSIDPSFLSSAIVRCRV